MDDLKSLNLLKTPGSSGADEPSLVGDYRRLDTPPVRRLSA